MTGHVSHQDRLTPRVAALLARRLHNAGDRARRMRWDLWDGLITPAQVISRVDEILTYLETELRAEIEETILMGDVE